MRSPCMFTAKSTLVKRLAVKDQRKRNGRHGERAAVPQVAAGAVLLAGAIAGEAILAYIAAALREVAIAGTADIAVAAQVIAKVYLRKSAVATARLAEHGTVRLPARYQNSESPKLQARERPRKPFFR